MNVSVCAPAPTENPIRAQVRTVPPWRARARRSVRGIGQPARCQRTGTRRNVGAS